VKGLAATLTAWQRPRPPVGTTPADVVHRENKLSLLRYRPRPEGVRFRTPVVLVPSLINRHYILDLLPHKSFAAFLVAQGHDVYAIDWGTPGDEDRYLTFDDVTDRYLGRVVRRVARTSERDQAHLLGYCLGGILTAIHAAARPEHVASLALLAAPVRFHDDGMLSTWVRSPTFDLGAMIDAFGNVPWQLMQGAFQLLRPTLPLAKAVTMLDRAWNDEFLDGFLALETWGNDNVSFPGACYRRYIEDLYRADALARGELRLSGRPARLDAITCPVLAVTFEHDEIVPWKSAAAVLDLISSTDKHHMHLPGGHVGAVVSKAASRGLWPALSTFWAERD
jgi:polyhydroxyalkanoate synthase